MGKTQEENTKTIISNTMTTPKVTVLVAVYNAEKYIRKCLDSLIEQTLTDIQVVCIDDASTDNSLSILNEYAVKDNRIEVIALTENHGQAHARNQGLGMVRGQYVCFLDSDDWMSADCLEKAVDCFTQHPLTDSVLFDTRYVYPDREESYPMPKFEAMSGKEAFEASLTWKIHGVYIVKAEIHKDFPYDESCKAYSDDNTTRLHYLSSREVRTCEGRYYYLQHGESTTHKTGLQRFDYLKANMSMKQTLLKIGAEERILDLYENVRWLNVVGLMYYVFLNRKLLSKGDIKEGMRIIRWAWNSIEQDRLEPRYKRKLGYMPMKWSWNAFVVQENVYFTLKALLNRR